MNTPQPVFQPQIYEVNSLDEAKARIVTPEEGTTTEERWVKETDYLAREIGRHLAPEPEDDILDFGCGVGRLSKEMIERFGCRVVGVDASQSMRLLAPEYVLSERFIAWSPDVLAKMTERGFRFSKAVIVWVLQHVLDPQATIEQIHAALEPGASVYVLNQDTRCVPTNLGYVNDGKDVGSLLRAKFEVVEKMNLPEDVTTPVIANCSSIFLLRKPE